MKRLTQVAAVVVAGCGGRGRGCRVGSSLSSVAIGEGVLTPTTSTTGAATAVYDG